MVSPWKANMIKEMTMQGKAGISQERDTDSNQSH
jgi:hypothetical protein